MIQKIKEYRISILVASVALVLVLAIFFVINWQKEALAKNNLPPAPINSQQVKAPEKPKVAHISTPEPVKAIYVTSWVATLKERRQGLVKLVKDTELNAVVIDIKDYSGKVLFDTQNPEIKALGTEEIRMKDIKNWIDELHKEGIYVIARLTVFQDPVYATKFPDQAVQTLNGAVWRDRNDLAFVDVSSKPFWDYIIQIAKAAEQIGFDEINFDYIRFPSDGNMKDIKFPQSGDVLAKTKPKSASPNAGASANVAIVKSAKQQRLETFFKYLHAHAADIGIPISADLFGMVTTNKDDLGIGQVLESAAPYFNYICPMVYPSHYPRGYLNYKNPADHPYEIIHYAMSGGVARMKAMNQDPKKLRPWLQDFNLGAKYDETKVRAQIKATYDAGLTSFLMWDPRNKYTKGAYLVSEN